MKYHMKVHNFKDKILNFAKKDKIITTSEIARKFEISWNTAEKYLLEMALDDKFTRLKKERVNLWVLK
jgi:predicted HTH transcriptional regulator